VGYCGSECVEQQPYQAEMMETKKINSRFGEIEYEPDKTIYFPEGMIGFEGLRHFVVMPNDEDMPLCWIQSAEDPCVAFILADPTLYFPEYRLRPGKPEMDKLGLDKGEDCFVLTVVTVHPDGQITFNLAAPILFAPEKNKAIQVILENAGYPSRVPLSGAKAFCPGSEKKA
jgi:flagellar assembly factor FliW